MERVDKIQSQARVAWPLGGTYNTVGIIAACCDFLLIVISSVIVDFFYRNVLGDGSDKRNAALGVGLIVCVIFMLIAIIFDLYKLTCLLAPGKHIARILITWSTSILLVTAIIFLLRAGTLFSRGSTTSFAIAVPVPLIFFRLLAARALQSLITRGAISGRRAVIVGEEFELSRLSPSSLLIDFGVTEITRISLRGSPGLDVLSNEELTKLDSAISVARQENAEELVIAFDWGRIGLLQEIAGRLRKSPLPVRLLPDRVVQSIFERGTFSTNGQTPSIELQRAPLNRTERFAKRGCDIALALIALVLLAPLMLLTALAIKLDSAGPIIFRQRRTGFNGRMFFIYKFRTMSVMEDGPDIVQTRRVDPRVTKVGRLLRQSSIDELPQLFNVLGGDMSLVGPRPHALAHDDHYGAMISSYAYRHHVKPGITGWAQVNGQRGETRRIEDMEKRIELDLWYVNNWSLILDLRIIWRTCFELLQHRAY